MARTEGSKNKPKELLELNSEIDNENMFLAEMIRAKTYWTQKAKELKDKNLDNTRELEYADFYKLGINKFTEMENQHPDKT